MVYSRFKFLLDEYGLNAIEKVVVHGQVEGFYALISVEPQNNLYYIMLGLQPNEEALSLEPLFESLRNLPTIQSVTQEATALVIRGKVSIKKKKMLQAIREILDTSPNKLRQLGYQAGDFKTGMDDGTVKLTQFNQYYTYLSEENYQATLEEVQQLQANFANKKENMLLGLSAAFIGALIGGLLWFAIGLLGYIAWIAGVIALFLAFKGYQLFGGKVSRIGVALVFILTISVVFLANHAVWAWIANDGYDPFFWTTFSQIHQVILTEPSIRTNYLIDVGVGVGVIILTGVPFMRSLYKENARDYQVIRHP